MTSTQRRGSSLTAFSTTTPSLSSVSFHVFFVNSFLSHFLATAESLKAAFLVSLINSLLLMLHVQIGNTHHPVHKGEFCHTDTFRANCSDDQIIIMQSATYGRMRLGRCVEIALGHVGCSADVLRMADRRCSGKHFCSVRVPDAEFEGTRPCLKELKTYLEASFQCVPVQTLTSEICRTKSEFSVSSESGFIASIITSDTPSCDGSRQPWTIRASAGRRIILTLYDFALERETSSSLRPPAEDRDSTVPAGIKWHQHSPVEASAGGRCRQYGMLEDTISGKTFVICGGQERIRNIYTSEHEIVKVWITAGIGPRDLQRFAIHYSVVGCADLTFSEEDEGVYWFSRSSDDLATVGCKQSTSAWNIKCINGTWKGGESPRHNCSSPASASSSANLQSVEAQERNADNHSVLDPRIPPQSHPHPQIPHAPSSVSSTFSLPSSSSSSFSSSSQSYFLQLSSIQFIASVVALSTGIVVVVASVSFIAILKNRRKRERIELRTKRHKMTEIMKDFGEKSYRNGELVQEIQTLSSSLSKSGLKGNCQVSDNWNSRFSHLDSFN